MKYLRSTTSGCLDIGIRKSEFVTYTLENYKSYKQSLFILLSEAQYTLVHFCKQTYEERLDATFSSTFLNVFYWIKGKLYFTIMRIYPSLPWSFFLMSCKNIRNLNFFYKSPLTMKLKKSCQNIIPEFASHPPLISIKERGILFSKN